MLTKQGSHTSSWPLSPALAACLAKRAPHAAPCCAALQMWAGHHAWADRTVLQVGTLGPTGLLLFSDLGGLFVPVHAGMQYQACSTRHAVPDLGGLFVHAHAGMLDLCRLDVLATPPSFSRLHSEIRPPCVPPAWCRSCMP